MKKPNKFTVYITDPEGIRIVEETTFLNTTYYLLLEQKGYSIQIWEDTRYKARERLYRIVTGKKKSVYNGFSGAILNF